jgi:hypothetical protein
MGAAQGFLEGAHDGAVVTFYHALDTISMGLLSELLPFDSDWLIDPDTPFLEVSAWMGTIAGIALQTALLNGSARLLKEPASPSIQYRMYNALKSSSGGDKIVAGQYNRLTGVVSISRDGVRHFASRTGNSTRTELYRTAYHEAFHKAVDPLSRLFGRVPGSKYAEEVLAEGYGRLRALIRELRR